MMSPAPLAVLVATATAFLLSAVFPAAAAEIKVSGFVDVTPSGPGGALSVPLPGGAAPVTVLVSLGEPAVQVAVQITATTLVSADTPLPVTLVDGDRVKIEALVVGGVLQAQKIEVEDFPEVSLPGTVAGLPGAGLSLPLAPGTVAVFTLSLGSLGSVPVQISSATRIDDAPFLLVNGASVIIEGIFRNLAIEATELELGG